MIDPIEVNWNCEFQTILEKAEQAGLEAILEDQAGKAVCEEGNQGIKVYEEGIKALQEVQEEVGLETVQSMRNLDVDYYGSGNDKLIEF